MAKGLARCIGINDIFYVLTDYTFVVACSRYACCDAEEL